MIDIPDGVDLVLASGSPRRRELLERSGLVFDVIVADIDETPRPGESPTAYVRRLSIEKASAVADHDQIVIGADTTVEIDGRILEKPSDRADAARMLRALSGRVHRCHTGVTVIATGCGHETVTTEVVTTEVRFAELSEAMIEWYLGTGEADDKAGAYGIQGAAAVFVERVDGSVSNVVGLPLAETLGMLRRTLPTV